MDALTVLNFLIICSVSRAGFLDFSELDKGKFQNEFFKNEGAHSSSLEDSNETQALRKRKFSIGDSTYLKDTSGDQRRTGFPNVPVNSNAIVYRPKELLQVNEVPMEKHTYDYFPFYPNRQNYFENTYENTQLLREMPQRRHTKEWRVSDDLLDPKSIPWIGDAYYPKSGFNEHMIDSTHPQSSEEEETPLIVAAGYADPIETPKPPQYYQKNYYYNYYPLVNQRKMKWPENYSPEEAKKNFDAILGKRKNPCRHYLDFLKYAFDKLDEDAEKNYDYGDWMIKDSGLPPLVLGTKLLGPTFYVDNSGKISQINKNGNSVQVAEGVSPDSKIAVFSKTISQPFPSTYIPPLDEATLSFTPEDHWTVPPAIQEERNRGEPTRTTIESQKTEDEYDYDDVKTTPVMIQGRMADSINKIFGKSSETTSTSNPPWFSSSIIPQSPPGNLIKSKTTVSFSNSTDDADCNDKMLPCPDTVNITYPLNGYCNRYVSCESGRAIRRTCPDGLHFNVVIKSCDLPHNSICTYTCPKPNGLFGIPGDCQGYFSCKNSNLEYRMCPPKMHWDINRGICIFSELSSCPMKCSQNNDIKPYEGDCKAYVICLNDIPYYHRCPPNTRFSKKDLICVPSTMSQCKDDPRLVTEMLNPSTLCKDIQLQMNTKGWCRSFMNLKD